MLHFTLNFSQFEGEKSMKIKGIAIIFIILIGSTTAYAASNGPNNSIIQNSPSIDIELLLTHRSVLQLQILLQNRQKK